MAVGLFSVPTQDSVQYTLNSSMGATDTTLTLNQSVAGIVQAAGAGGVAVIDRVDSNGNKTPTLREYITFTGVSGSQLTGLVRGLAGSTAQTHAVGAIVEFIPDIIWAQAIYDTILKEHSFLGQHTSLASVSFLSVSNLFSASGASIIGFPSSASGSYLTSNSPSGYAFSNAAVASTDGWTADANTWTYASATSFTTSGNQTAVYKVGTYVKWNDSGGQKYGVVASSSYVTNTTVNLIANNDYSMANSAITSPAYSYAANPQGFPVWFAYTTTYGGFSVNPASTIRYAVIGRTVFVKLETTGAGTSNATTFTLTAPIAAANTNNAYSLCLAVDAGAETSATAKVTVNSTTIALYKGASASAAWTASGNKYAYFVITYEI